MRKVFIVLIASILLFSCESDGEKRVEEYYPEGIHVYLDMKELAGREIYSLPSVLSSVEEISMILDGRSSFLEIFGLTRPLVSCISFYLGFDSYLKDSERIYQRGDILMKFSENDSLLISKGYGGFVSPEKLEDGIISLKEDGGSMFSFISVPENVRDKVVTSSLSVSDDMVFNASVTMRGEEEARAVLSALRMKILGDLRREGKHPDMQELARSISLEGTSVSFTRMLDESELRNIFTSVIGGFQDAVL